MNEKNIARINRYYEPLSRILTENELLYLEDLIPADDKKHEELRDLIIAARRWRHHFGKTDRDV